MTTTLRILSTIEENIKRNIEPNNTDNTPIHQSTDGILSIPL